MSFVKGLARSDMAMSINDVLATDWKILMDILDSQEKKEEVVDLFDFIGSLDG